MRSTCSCAVDLDLPKPNLKFDSSQSRCNYLITKLDKNNDVSNNLYDIQCLGHSNLLDIHIHFGSATSVHWKCKRLFIQYNVFYSIQYNIFLMLDIKKMVIHTKTTPNHNWGFCQVLHILKASFEWIGSVRTVCIWTLSNWICLKYEIFQTHFDRVKQFWIQW